jgi:hypothetical protein
MARAHDGERRLGFTVTSGTRSRKGREEGRGARRDPYHAWKLRRQLAVGKWRCRGVIAMVRLGQRRHCPRVERRSGDARLGGKTGGGRGD